MQSGLTAKVWKRKLAFMPASENLQAIGPFRSRQSLSGEPIHLDQARLPRTVRLAEQDGFEKAVNIQSTSPNGQDITVT